MKISVIGSGVVGTEIGRGLKKLGHGVIFFDISEKRLKELERNGLTVSRDMNYAVKNSEVSFISVPTPTKKGKIDLSFVKSAVKSVARCLRNKGGYHLIVIKSTILPLTTEKHLIPLIEKYSGKKIGSDIGVCVNPEFLTEIHKTWTDNSSFARSFFNEDRIVIGELDKKSGDILENLYKPLGIPIFRTDLKTAEMIKYASNCILATKISYWNEIFLICRKLGIDSQKVADIVALDPRIGKYGTVHGKAFGGKCLPKDLEAFITFARKYFKPKILTAVDKINKYMAKHFGVRE